MVSKPWLCWNHGTLVALGIVIGAAVRTGGVAAVTAGDVVAAGREGDRVAVVRAVVVRNTLVGQDIVSTWTSVDLVVLL